MNKTKTATYYIEDIELTFSSDVFDGEPLDTKVFVAGSEYLCTIAGCDIESFKNDLSALVDRYKI